MTKTLSVIKQEAREGFRQYARANLNDGQPLDEGKLTVDLPYAVEVLEDLLEETLDRLVDEIEKAVFDDMRSPYRPDDKEFYNDVHRETGFVCAWNLVKEAFTRFKGEVTR